MECEGDVEVPRVILDHRIELCGVSFGSAPFESYQPRVNFRQALCERTMGSCQF